MTNSRPSKTPSKSSEFWKDPQSRCDRRQLLFNSGSFLRDFIGRRLLDGASAIFPAVLMQSSMRVNAGRPEDYSLGVSEKFLKSHRFWLVREEQGFFALWARCSHLGCTPKLAAESQGFQCPCHGSAFDVAGKVGCGPAKRPLSRCAVSLSRAGDLIIDKQQTSDRLEDFEPVPPYYLPYSADPGNSEEA